MALRRLVALLGLAFCAAVTAGCGGDALAFDPVANAANKTADSTSSRVAFTATITAGTIGTMSFSGAGIYDGPSRSGRLNMNFSLPPAAQAQLGGNPSMEMIFDGHDGLVMYMRSPLFRTLPAGTWVKMDLKKLADKAGVDLSALMNANQADPSQALRMLMASSGAKVVNYDRVRGVLTTHYSFRIDLKRLADENKALGDSLRRMMTAAGIDSYPAEAWIDKDGRVRRIKVSMNLGPAAGNATMTLIEDLYAFGIKVNIQPPTDRVVDMSALTGS